MSAQVTNEQLLEVLLRVEGRLGAVEANVKNTAISFASHVEDDRRLGGRVASLELHKARQAGQLSILAAIFSAVGAALWAALSYFVRHWHA